jgi:hypothetical protein
LKNLFHGPPQMYSIKISFDIFQNNLKQKLNVKGRSQAVVELIKLGELKIRFRQQRDPCKPSSLLGRNRGLLCLYIVQNIESFVNPTFRQQVTWDMDYDTYTNDP